MKKTLEPAAAGAVLLCLATGSALAQSSDSPDMSWTESRWGPNNEIGAANRLTPELTRMAAGLVTEGKVYSLGITLDKQVPALPPRSLSIAILQPGQVNNSGLGPTMTT